MVYQWALPLAGYWVGWTAVMSADKMVGSMAVPWVETWAVQMAPQMAVQTAVKKAAQYV
jgi:hypothetical protein